MRQVSDEIAAANLDRRLASVIAEAKATSANVSTASAGPSDSSTASRRCRTGLNACRSTSSSPSANASSAPPTRSSQAPGLAEVPPNLAAALDELRGPPRQSSARAAPSTTSTPPSPPPTAPPERSRTPPNDLPALLANLNAVAARADTALASVSPGSDLNRDTVLLLQEVRDAARSINSLVLALERRPNSVLFGR